MRLDELELSAPNTVALRELAYTRAPSSSSAAIENRATSFSTYGFPVALSLVLLAGILLRLFLPAGFNGTGFDENLYRTYVVILDHVGISHYATLIDGFVIDQLNPDHMAILPPTRIFYIVGGYAYHHLFALTPLSALRALSCHFSILTLLVSILFCWRLTRRPMFTTAVAALLACDPAQIHLGQHALIDGIFGFWALLVVWLLWENLRQPDSARWQVSYAFALAAMVMTKENAFFVFAAVLAILVSNRWFKFGHVNRRLVLTTFLGATAGFAVVVIAAGGLKQFVLVFELLKQKVPVLPYTIHTGGGPWHRYLVDLLLVSPFIIVLAMANILQSGVRYAGANRYLTVFSCVTYAILMAFPDGMNLRYIVMLDMPLRFLAADQTFALAKNWGRYKNALLACAIIMLCGYDLRQHRILFVKGALYKLVTEGLVRAQGVIR